jgi:cysteine desulfuration protein SufE
MKNPSHTISHINDIKNTLSWEEKYKKIIDWGKELAAYPEEFRDEKFKVKGCQSQVWLHAARGDNGIVIFQADSDALLVKGLIAILLNEYSGKTPEEILKIDVGFVKDAGLDQHLTPSRTNGLVAMIKQIRSYAQAFYLMDKK